VSASSLIRGTLASGVTPLDATRPYALIAAGKASAAMVEAWYAHAAAEPGEAVAVGTHDRHRLPPRVEWFEGGHPTPTVASVAAARAAVALAGRVPADGQLVVLLSGGASALLSLPAEGLTLDDKQQATRGLMHDGRAIDELNAVRKHLSAIKGGRLTAACAGQVITLAISDVVGPVEDDPSVIGSGPTVPDPSTYAQARRIVEGVQDAASIPRAVREHLARGVDGQVPETPKPGDPMFARAVYQLIGTRRTGMSGAQARALELGLHTIVLDPPIEGEARVAGASFVQRVLDVTRAFPGPVCVIASGETTVTVRGKGRGGRNQEFVAGAIGPLARAARPLVMASIGTDGIDGPTDAAGAWADASTAAAAAAAGLDVDAFLDRNDAYHLHEALGTLIRTGRTDTNVGDVQVAVVY
jgi:hydroxypyruvate reductase